MSIIDSLGAIGSIGSGGASGASGAGSVSQVPAVTSIDPISAPGGASGVTGAASAGGSDFGSALANAVDSVQATQENANDLAVDAVTGKLSNVADATIAATQAQVNMELVSAVRNKGVDAFNQIMNMQA